MIQQTSAGKIPKSDVILKLFMQGMFFGLVYLYLLQHFDIEVSVIRYVVYGLFVQCDFVW